MARFLKGHPFDLAVFRVVVFVVILGSDDVRRAWRWAALPADARMPVAGWDWAIALWWPSVEAAQALSSVFLVCAVFGLLGLFTRVATVGAALIAPFLLGLPQASGQVLHSHHLVWFLVLLSASPCGNAFSIDAWRRKRSIGEAVEYGLPIRLAWLSVGPIFFFAGFWKLAEGGLDWGDSLSRQMEAKAFETGLAPWIRPGPALLRQAGLLAICFELSVGVLLLWGRTRLFALVAALLFHAGVRATMGISFSALWACYVIFIPWARWLEFVPSPEPPRSRRWIPAAIAGTVLLLLQCVAGVLGEEQSWPVACYPTFRHAPTRDLSWLEVDVGSQKVLGLDDLRGPEGQRWWGVGWRLLANPTPRALEAHYRMRRGDPPPGAVDFFRATANGRTLLWHWAR